MSIRSNGFIRSNFIDHY
ncbi:MAG TPA: hypothetical protein DIW81_21835 [Planctomycetaceae bacterium]|nr:hypothetical protein [Planctomycetaceae bacterium]